MFENMLSPPIPNKVITIGATKSWKKFGSVAALTALSVRLLALSRNWSARSSRPICRLSYASDM